MKLTLAIFTALVGTVYLIVKSVAPDFPLTEAELLKVFLWGLAALGVVLAEAKTRAALIARGYTGFISK